MHGPVPFVARISIKPKYEVDVYPVKTDETGHDDPA
jgi:hypothetical protein